jgi:hypothetical protein
MFKNWKAICEILDPHFMWAIALLNLTTDFGQMVASRFPEYFTDKEQQGPIPMSVLVEKAIENERDCAFSAEYIVSCGAPSHFNIPIIEFAIDEQAQHDYDVPLLPVEISRDDIRSDDNDRMGHVVEWRGKKLVLLEYNVHTGLISFAPAECIAVDK